MLPPLRLPITEGMVAVLAEAMAMHAGSGSVDDLSKRVALMGHALIFPNLKGEALSDAALGAVIHRMNGAGNQGEPPRWRDVDGRPATPHGFRRSFRTWTDDERPTDAAAAEMQLNHDDANKVAAAYRSSDLLARRRPLMTAWGAYCLGRGADVVSIEDARAQRG